MILSSHSTTCHVPTATSPITNNHAIATTSLRFSVPAFPSALDPQNADFAGVWFPLYRDSVFKVHAYAIHLLFVPLPGSRDPSLARSPWDNYNLPQSLLFVNSFLRFFLFFFQKVLHSLCANGYMVFRPIPLYIIYYTRQVKICPFPIFLYILYNTTHINVKHFCAN